MHLREATIDDVEQIQIVRHTVRENILSNPDLVTDQDCVEYLTLRGKGWVCEMDKQIVGFAIADLKEDNIWALFLRPEYEGKGIGQLLHNKMLDWYFTSGREKVWLGTSPNTRAECFYRKSGWKQTGFHGIDELKFEMTKQDWLNRK